MIKAYKSYQQGPFKQGLNKGLLGPLCGGPLHTQWEPYLGDGLRRRANFSGKYFKLILTFRRGTC